MSAIDVLGQLEDISAARSLATVFDGHAPLLTFGCHSRRVAINSPIRMPAGRKAVNASSAGEAGNL
jgi:hypothetical protein